jgi:hypothetical protein
MEASVQRLPGGGLTHQTVSETESAAASELKCRVCELEEDNTRLRLLVGELLVANQRLRERSQA